MTAINDIGYNLLLFIDRLTPALSVCRTYVIYFVIVSRPPDACGICVQDIRDVICYCLSTA